MKSYKLFVSLVLVFAVLMSSTFAVAADNKPSLDILAKSSILIEASTGQVLYENAADEHLPIASVTKVMTMLLIMEAIDDGDLQLSDMVSVSPYAASMGGSQVFLEPGEQMSVSDMLKAIAVASGNDACVAMAEHIAGSESEFVNRMNEKAKALGMQHTNFMNCNGLDTDNHYSSARDVAIMSRELIKHEKIFEYLTIWMDSLRDGKFGLANTNKMVRFYSGGNGIKTGSTDQAKFCVSAGAKRDNMQLIAVVLGSPTSKDRFADATKLLDYGFANYAITEVVGKAEDLGVVDIKRGVNKTVGIETGTDFKALMSKGKKEQIERIIEMQDGISAPIKKGQKLGVMKMMLGGKEIGFVDIVAREDVDKYNFFNSFSELFRSVLSS